MSGDRFYRKRPVVIEAVQWDGNWDAMLAFVGENRVLRRRDVLRIRTLEGNMSADIGDWIIRGVQGEFYPCKPAIFYATYEAVA